MKNKQPEVTLKVNVWDAVAVVGIVTSAACLYLVDPRLAGAEVGGIVALFACVRSLVGRRS